MIDRRGKQLGFAKAGAQQGFVLAATLWVLAFITIALGYFSLWTQQAVETAQQRLTDIEVAVDMESTFAGVLYMLNTYPMGPTGLDLLRSDDSADEPPENRYLPLDDTPMQGYGSVVFSLQDESGLIPINAHHHNHLRNLLGLFGVPGGERDVLLARLADYIDNDELVHLNGAESADYLRQNLAPPANHELRTGWESRDVMGWTTVADDPQNQLLPRYLNVVWNGVPNFNTAPAKVLTTWPGIDQKDAEMIVETRKKMPLKSVSDLSLILGHRLLIDPMAASFFPTRYIRLTLRAPSTGQAREIHLELRPNADWDKPWFVDYALSLADNRLPPVSEPRILDVAPFAQ